MAHSESGDVIARKIGAFRASFIGNPEQVRAALEKQGLIGAALERRESAELEAMVKAWAQHRNSAA